MKRRDPNKIFMCSSVHVWSDTRIYFKEAKSLAEAGFQVEFYALNFDGEKESIPNLTMHYLPVLSRKKRFRHMQTLLKAFEESDAKNFHFHDPELLFLARKIKKKYGDAVKIVYDMHEHLPAAILTKQWIPRGSRPFVSKMVAFFEKYFLKWVDAVVFAEVSYKENYLKMGLNTVDVLNYPIMPPVRNETISKVFTLIYVGVLTEQRGLFNMLELAKAMREKGCTDFKLKLIGPMFTNEDAFSEFIIVNHLEKNVEHLDRMQYKDIWRHYYQSHIGLCLLHPTPNNLNSHSTKLFEYMAAKIPILASDFPDFKKIISEADCGYTTDPFDYGRAADLVIQLKDNRKRNWDLGQNGFRAFQNLYSWQHEAEKLLTLYESFEKSKN
ncbi:glycosyltransferase family 4 protein [Listeria fleischmannii]|uniref:Glycosyltransferase family 4 protein n=2 Tax=Listeria fleischmannii TaxID=1069827 RepID=A0A841YFY6_9LIST|nr:glycosyltransferase family 4 protein [Listeria fleischmannii]MBC1399166.1 glycosyltransferase family 4 protein [Listeria fleischmannii]MBC1427470.1 glycosyltransferase family 4 protein [Listeria fleischmannii]